KIKDNYICLFNKIINFESPGNNFQTYPQSTTTLLHALEKISSRNILLTLPTNKDQLILNTIQKNDYTEFLRSFYNLPHITIAFFSPKLKVTLITDHIALKDVSNVISKQLVEEKISNTIDSLRNFYPVKDVLISGINPHTRENG